MMSMKDAAETLVHYIKHACRDMSPDMLAELDLAVKQFEKADEEVQQLRRDVGPTDTRAIAYGGKP